jgi:hypothetical protein
MSQIETWSRLAAAIRHHLIDPMRDRNITLEDLTGCESGWNQSSAYPKGHGTRTLARLSCAAKAPVPKLSFCPGKLWKVKNFKQFGAGCKALESRGNCA